MPCVIGKDANAGRSKSFAVSQFNWNTVRYIHGIKSFSFTTGARSCGGLPCAAMIILGGSKTFNEIACRISWNFQLAGRHCSQLILPFQLRQVGI